MYQDFSDLEAIGNDNQRPGLLRQELSAVGLDGFLIPHSDEYQNEYLPPCAERLAWLTGFTGSAGFSIVFESRAILFVDSRYTLQAASQVDPEIFQIEDLVSVPPSKWLEDHAPKGAKIGYDRRLLTIRQEKQFKGAAKRSEWTLVPTDNLVDRVWTDRFERK